MDLIRESRESSVILVRLGQAAAFAFALFATLVVAAHIVRPELGWTTNFLSEYAIGPRHSVMTAAFVVHGMGILLLAAALWRQVDRSWITRTGLLLLALAGLGALAIAAFPMDPKGTDPLTFSGTIHDSVALVHFLSATAATLLVSLRFGRSVQWRSHYRSEMTLALLALASLVAFLIIYPLQAGDNPPRPEFSYYVYVSQRLVVATLWLWLLVTALRMQRSE